MDIVNLIGTLGFPIVAYLLLFFKLDKTVGALQSTLSDLVVAIKEGEK